MNAQYVAEGYDMAGRVVRVTFCDSLAGAISTVAYWEQVHGLRGEVHANGATVTA